MLRFAASFLVVAASLLVWPAVTAGEESVIVEDKLLDVEIDGKATELEVFFAKEAGASAKLPVAIFTHGLFADPKKRARMKASNFRAMARDLARRGWLAAVVLRRGYGKSRVVGIDYKTPNCRNRDYGPAIDAQTDDLEAALKAITKRPDADPTRIVAMGISAGSMAALNLGTRELPGLKAVVNFSGGIRTTVAPGKKPGRKTCRQKDLVRWLGEAASKRRFPTLWLYAENDPLFEPEFVREMHKRYTESGGAAELRIFGPIGENGHLMFSDLEGILQWWPAVDAFFRQNGLSTYDAAPMEAALLEFNIGEKGQAVARRYHGRHTEKALAVSRSGSRVAAQFGADRLEAAEAEALRTCEKESGEECRILWRNFETVPDGKP